MNDDELKDELGPPDVEIATDEEMWLGKGTDPSAALLYLQEKAKKRREEA